MKKEYVLKYITGLVNEKHDSKKYPVHWQWRELVLRAEKDIPNFDPQLMRQLINELVKEKLLFWGFTCNDIWISYKTNNIDE